MSATPIGDFDPFAPRYPWYPPCPNRTAGSIVPSVAEQMGVDPISKLAAAIHDLAAALRETQAKSDA